jgi:hypothetical protein
VKKTKKKLKILSCLVLNKMSSYVAAGNNLQYVLPFQMDAVPSSFKSNLAPRPINCVLQTVNVQATSGNQTVGGTTTIQVPLGNSAYICNPYLRFRVVYTGVNTDTFRFKGSAGGASALISSLQTSINSTLIDNIQNYGLGVMEPILSHSTSRDWLVQDGSVLMNTTVTSTLGAAGLTEVYCMPLLGLLGAQQAFPAWAVNGVLQLNINWVNSIAAAIGGATGAASVTALSFQDVQFVYDRVAVEGDFIAKMKSDMASSGAKFTYSFTNYQTLTAASTNGQNTINTGINVSSLRGALMTSVVTADLADMTTRGFSIRNGLSNYQLSLDGRLVNSSILDAVNAPAVCFAELQKVFSRIFDASVTDNSTKALYLTDSFAIGVSACRVAEGLAFQGSPVSVATLQITQNATTATNFIVFIADYSLLIGADGMCDLVR